MNLNEFEAKINALTNGNKEITKQIMDRVQDYMNKGIDSNILIKDLTELLGRYGFNFKKTGGALHIHSENSMDDAIGIVNDIIDYILKMGGHAFGLSDHGTQMGIDDADDYVKGLVKAEKIKKEDFKVLFGIEAYYVDDTDRMGTRSHLILYPKDNVGLEQIQIAMSRGSVVETTWGGTLTCLTNENLETLRGGHVIATSACIQGPFGSIITFNHNINEKIAKHQAAIDEYAESIIIYDQAKNDFDEASERLDICKANVSEAKAAAKKSYTGKEKSLASMKKKLEKAEAAFDKFLEDDTERNAKSVRVALAQLEVVVEDSDDFQDGIEEANTKYNQRCAQLKSEMEKSAELAKTLKQREAEMEDAKADKAEAKKSLEDVTKDITKVETHKEKIKELSEQKLTKEESEEIFVKRLRRMMDIFGKNFYMEMQYHGIPLEKTIYPWLANVAAKHHIPLVAANDAHVVTNTPEQFKRRQIRRSCRFKKFEDTQVGDDQLYIKTDIELALALYQILNKNQVVEAMNNVTTIIDACNATIERGSHAPKAKGLTDSEAKEEIIRIARANIEHKYGKNGWTQEHEDRFNYEVGIIDSMGFNHYFVITYDIVNIARKIGGLSYKKLDELKKIMDNMTLKELTEYIDKYDTEVNLSVGLGRGSGAGSIVCFLLGITNIDPLKYDLIFERFLNPERISMPDIDSDFRTDIKDVLLVYLKKKYGERAIAQILTKSYLQGKSAIDKVVMILASRESLEYNKTETDPFKRKQYESDISKRYRSIAEKLKKKTGVDFSKSMEENRAALMAGVSSDIEKEIVETSIIMDNNLDHTGLHAAGVIISDNDDLAEYIPVAWDTGFKTWKTQCNMIQGEGKHGLLKMDLLLLKTLDIVTYALRMIKKTHPNDKIDIENLPFEEEVFKNIYAAGDTKAVFQFESGGMIKFLRQLQPTCIDDIIAANAMYRPGPMDSIPDYVAAKHSGKITYDCPELEPILKSTYGQIIYQEQVMRIVRDLAGYSMGRSDLVRRAMAKKHMDELVAERKNFIYGNKETRKEGEAEIHGCVAIGISEEAANKIFDKMISFASYAFNHSHAAVYSITSYMTAWLKYHYPAEFYCSVMNFVGAQKELPSLIADAQKHGIKVLRPDINRSKADFATENGNIRYGLRFLANAASRADVVIGNRENGYKSFKEFVKIRPGSAMAKACIYSGACDSYLDNCDKRNALMAAYEFLSDTYDGILRAEERIEKAEKEINRKKAEQDRDALVEVWNNYQMPVMEPLSMMERLSEEQKLTSVYFSSNPLDGFEINEKRYTTIDNLEDEKETWIAAVISEKNMLKTKKDSLPMMSGSLSDRSGTIRFIMFPRTYAKVAGKIETVMGFNGHLSAKDDEEPQFIVSDVQVLPPKNMQMIIKFDDYAKVKALVAQNKVDREHGIHVRLVGNNTPCYNTAFYVTEDWVKSSGLEYYIEHD